MPQQLASGQWVHLDAQRKCSSSLPLQTRQSSLTSESSRCWIWRLISIFRPDTSCVEQNPDKCYSYHANYGGPGVNLETGAHSPDPYNYDDSDMAVFATEYDLNTNELRKLHPKTNTFCSAGAFLPDGTMVNFAGAEPDAKAGVGDGFDAIRTYPPGPCANGACDMDFTEGGSHLQAKRWYPTAETLPNGDILSVGGSDVGLLVLNEASINVPTYELIKADGSAPPPPVTLPILEFTEEQNNQPNKSYNLYPIRKSPNATTNHTPN